MQDSNAAVKKDILHSLNAWRMTTFYLGQIKVMLF